VRYHVHIEATFPDGELPPGFEELLDGMMEFLVEHSEDPSISGCGETGPTI